VQEQEAMEIRPFRGWRYPGDSTASVTGRVAPPYDVLSQADKDALLAADPRNIVAVDLPHVPPKDVGPHEAYQGALDTLEQWKASGVLIHETLPAVYAYEQTYKWAGREYSRRAMICGVRATELGQGVIPHEHTFEGPKADRLKLSQYTRMQLSPIFGFYHEPSGNAAEALWAAAAGPPTIHAQLKDVTEKLWVVTAPEVIASVQMALRDVPVYIADGHHRYTTAMNHAKALRAEGKIDAEHEANFVMFTLVEQMDPGMLILPTHRVMRGLSPEFSVERLVKATPAFAWKRCSVDDMDLRDAGSWLHKYSPGAMAFIGAKPAEIWIGRLTDAGAMAAAAPDHSEAWRKLDVAILQKLIVDKALAPWRTDAFFIEYTPDAKTVLAACNHARAQLGVCMQGTPLEAVMTIANAGESMPHKSTYFYPKIATGMVLKPLE